MFLNSEICYFKILISLYIISDSHLLVTEEMQKGKDLKRLFFFLRQKNYGVLTVYQGLSFTTNIKCLFITIFTLRMRKFQEVK